MDELGRLVWAGSSTFRLGDVLVGVRAHPEALHEGLRRVLAAHLVDTGEDPPPNYSVRLAGDGRPVRGLHLAYRRHTIVLRTRDARRLVTGLLCHLSSHAEAERPGEAAIDGLALVSEGAAVILPHWAWANLGELEPKLRAQGWRVVDRPLPTVDLTTGELVVREPALDVDEAALAGLLAELPAAGGRAETPLRAGRWPLAAWMADAVVRVDGEPPAGLGVFAAAGAVPSAGVDSLHAVAALRARVPLVPLAVGDLDGVTGTIGTIRKNLPAP